jgi:signal peptidase I
VRWSTGTAVALAALAAVGALWFALAPAAVGGSVDYAVVTGSSMQPLLAHGDLAVLHARPHYPVGAVVAYRNPQLGRVVLHRIVAERHGRFLFKGDNNSFVDTPQATRDELIGQLWFRIPKAGSAAVWLHRPTHAALAGGVLALLLLLPGMGAPARRRRRRPAATNHRLRVRSAVVGAAAICSAVCALAAAYAWTHASVRTISLPGAYTNSGTFTYNAPAPTGTVYPSGTAAAGEPIFVRLVHRVQLSFTYRFHSRLAHETAGAARLTTLLTSSLGWKRVIASGRARRFRGSTVRLSAAVDLPALEHAIATYLRTTGVPSDTFAVVVEPHVQLRGRVGGHALAQDFSPTLTFSLDPYSLRVQQPAPAATPGTPPPDPLHPVAAGTLTHTVPATLQVFGQHVRLTTLRRDAALAAAAAALLALLVATVRVRRRHRDLVVAIGVRPAGEPVDVLSLDELRALAYAEERVVLDDGQAFYVNGRSALYRFRPSDTEESTLELTPGLV